MAANGLRRGQQHSWIRRGSRARTSAHDESEYRGAESLIPTLRPLKRCRSASAAISTLSSSLSDTAIRKLLLENFRRTRRPVFLRAGGTQDLRPAVVAGDWRSSLERVRRWHR